MKIKTINSAFIILSVFLISCKKEKVDEPLVDESPVFYASANLGGEVINMSAGQENFYMESYSEIRKGVSYFSGKLTNTTTELEMGIYNGDIDKLTPSFASLLPDSLNFAFSSGQVLAVLSKDSFPNSSLIDEIQWFVDGTFAGVNEIQLTDPGKYSVCANVLFLNGSQSNLCNDLIVGYHRNVKSQLRHFLSQNGALQVWVDVQNVQVQSIQWILDGEPFGNSEKLVANIDQNSHVITANVIFQNGTKRTKSIIVDGSLNGRFVDDFSVFESQTTSVEQDFDVFVGLKKEGKYFRSDLINNYGSSVIINDISYYGLNSQGNPVFKLSAVINCILKEESTGEVHPFSCNTVFGVEVK